MELVANAVNALSIRRLILGPGANKKTVTLFTAPVAESVDHAAVEKQDVFLGQHVVGAIHGGV